MNALRLFRLLLSMDVGVNVLKFLVGDTTMKTLLDLYHGDIGLNTLPFSFTVDRYLCRKMREFTCMRVCVCLFGRRVLYTCMTVESILGRYSVLNSIPAQEKRCYTGFLLRFPWSVYDAFGEYKQFALADDMRRDSERVDLKLLREFIDDPQMHGYNL